MGTAVAIGEQVVPLEKYQAEVAAIRAENALLREFYDSWVFFHKCRGQSDAGETWDATRKRMAAEALAANADKVQAHISRIRAH